MPELDLESIVNRVLEKGADSVDFRKVTEELSEFSAADAIIILLRALSKNPELLLPRLELAKLLWQIDCVPFALEQLQSIYSRPGAFNRESISKLIEKLGGRLVQASTELNANSHAADSKTLASVDFDVEVLETE